MRKIILLTITFCVCSILTLNVFAQRRSSRRAPSTNSGQTEGEREAAKFWSNYVVSCGGSYYARKAPGVFVELRGFRIQMDYEPITEADRLNGIQAKGYSRYSATAYRVYSNSTWHQWGNGIPEDMSLTNSVRFQKAGGHWTFRGVGYFDEYARTVSCSDVPGRGGSTRNEVPTNTIQIDDYHVFPIEQFFFWESSSNEVGNRFSQSNSTFINWKIVYTETAFDYRPPPVESYWYKDGQQWAYMDSAQFSNESKGQLWTGKGWAEPGRWEIGKYIVKIYVGKKLVTVGNFEIISDDELPKTLRYDGLYQRENLFGDGGYYWFRFYEDGTVIRGNFPKGTNFDPLTEARYCLVKSESYRTSGRCRGYNINVGTCKIEGTKLGCSNISGSIGHNIITWGTYFDSTDGGKQKSIDLRFIKTDLWEPQSMEDLSIPRVNSNSTEATEISVFATHFHKEIRHSPTNDQCYGDITVTSQGISYKGSRARGGGEVHNFNIPCLDAKKAWFIPDTSNAPGVFPQMALDIHHNGLLDKFYFLRNEDMAKIQSAVNSLCK